MVWLRLWAVLLGGEFYELFLEEFPSGGIAQDFPGHIIDLVSYKITVLLCDIAEGTALPKVTADNAVVPLIASPFTAGVGMAIVDGQLLATVCVILHALAILELRTVVHGDGLEGALGKLRQCLAERFHSSLSRFTEDTQNYFITGQTFGEDQERLIWSFGLAYYTVKLPMTEGGPGVYFLRALL